MSTQELRDRIQCYIEASVPFILKGPPGVGKTALLYELASEENKTLVVLIGSIREPTDILGLPYRFQPADPTAAMITKTAAPDWAQFLATNGGWLFFDEINSCPSTMQSAFLRVSNERFVGDVFLPPETVQIMAAMNPIHLSAGGRELSAAMANRWAHVEFPPPDVRSWSLGLQSGFGKAFKKRELKSRAHVAAFLLSMPHHLLVVPEDLSVASGAWPSPRSWERVAAALGHAMARGMSLEVQQQIVADLVGTGVAIEYAVWRMHHDVPSAEDLIFGRKPLPSFERSDILFAAVGSITGYLRHLAASNPNALTPHVWDRACSVMATASEISKDVVYIAFKDFAKLTVSTSASTPPVINIRSGKFRYPESLVAFYKMEEKLNEQR